MDNLQEAECSIQGCRLVEFDIVITIYLYRLYTEYLNNIYTEVEVYNRLIS